jgi:hypothetical protein
MNPNLPSHHPAPEQWADYLYEELAPEVRASLEEHLRGCVACQRQLTEWRETMSALDACKVRPRVRPLEVFTTSVRWAAAAALVLGLGWLGGRLAAPEVPDILRLRAEVRADLEAELRQQFATRLQAALAAAEQRTGESLQALAATWAAARAEDQHTTLALFQRAERQRLSDYAALRRDLETVAVVAQDAIGLTQQQLTQLAANTLATPAGDGGLPR